MWLDREAWHGFVVCQLRFGYGQLGVALQRFAARVAIKEPADATIAVGSAARGFGTLGAATDLGVLAIV